MENNNDNTGSPTRVALIRGGEIHPIIELELEYEDDVPQKDESGNGQAPTTPQTPSQAGETPKRVLP